MADPQSYADSGTYFTPTATTDRRRLFDAMLQAGLDSSPIRSPWQGVGRLTQALVGGYGGYKADQDERKSLQEIGSILGGSLPQPLTVGKPGTDTPTPSPAAPTSPSASLTAPATGSSEPGTYPGVRPGTAFTDRWRAFLDDLRQRGVTIDPTQSGGYNPRNIRGTNTPSLHASDQAYDVNWTSNPEGQTPDQADIARQMLERDMNPDAPPVTQIHPFLARELAQQHGMRWGGDFQGRSPDPMHFEIAGGVPMGQRSITARAGLAPQASASQAPFPPPGPGPQVRGWQGGPAVPGNSEGLLPFPLPPLPPETPPAAPPQRPQGMNVPGLMQAIGNAQPGGPPPPGPPPPTLGGTPVAPRPGPAAPGAPPPGAPPPATSITQPLGTPSAAPGITTGSAASPVPPGAPPAPSQQPAPPAAPPAPAMSRGMPANDVIRRLLTSRNPQAIQYGLQLYSALAKPTADYDFQASEGSLYRVNKRTGEAQLVSGTGQGKPPPGYRATPNGGLEPIPGGPAEHLPGDMSGRLAMMQTARTNFAQARQYLVNQMGIGSAIGNALPFGAAISPQYDTSRRQVQVAVESALRVMTGAAAPESEVKQYMDMFMPRATDPPQVRTQKLNLLEGFMSNAEEIATRGHRPAGAPAGQGRVRTYNPQTGELE